MEITGGQARIARRRWTFRRVGAAAVLSGMALLTISLAGSDVIRTSRRDALADVTTPVVRVQELSLVTPPPIRGVSTGSILRVRVEFPTSPEGGTAELLARNGEETNLIARQALGLNARSVEFDVELSESATRAISGSTVWVRLTISDAVFESEAARPTSVKR